MNYTCTKTNELRFGLRDPSFDVLIVFVTRRLASQYSTLNVCGLRFKRHLYVCIVTCQVQCKDYTSLLKITCHALMFLIILVEQSMTSCTYLKLIEKPMKPMNPRLQESCQARLNPTSYPKSLKTLSKTNTCTPKPLKTYWKTNEFAEIPMKTFEKPTNLQKYQWKLKKN